jgi:hypothetical protein
MIILVMNMKEEAGVSGGGSVPDLDIVATEHELADNDASDAAGGADN